MDTANQNRLQRKYLLDQLGMLRRKRYDIQATIADPLAVREARKLIFGTQSEGSTWR